MYRGTSSSSRRGSWRGQTPRLGYIRNGRGSSVVSSSKPSATTAPLGRLIAEIAIDGSQNQADDAKIIDVKYAASYSLVSQHSSKIIIPGQPATWDPPQLPAQLPPDYGDYLRDHNGARFKHPLQPTVQSIFALNKGFDPSTVDIVGCASSLGDLLRFTRSVESTFRFDVEMVGNTLFVTRNHHKEVIPDVRGFGHSFLLAFLSHEDAMMKETESHQRIISYSFGGLKCLLRYECDGYFIDDHGLPLGTTTTTTKEPRDLNLPRTPTSNLIGSEKSGKIVPQESILEVKTRSAAKGELEMNEQLPRLWLRQIPNLVAAHHVRGKFADVQPRSVKQDIVRWEAQHADELRSFAAVLRQLVVEAKRASHLKLELCRTSSSGPLELREQTGTPREALPAYWRDKWAGEYRDDSDGDVSGGDGQPNDEKEGCAHSDDGCPDLSRSSESSDAEGSGAESDGDFVLDFTGCDSSCGYCGRCT